MLKRINGRAFVSLILFLSVWVMLITSVLMFIHQRETSTAMVHTIVGFTLLAVVFWHLKNNFSPLLQYLKFRTRGTKAKVNVALPVAVLVGFSLIGLSLIQFRPLLAFYEWGSTLRAGDSAAEQSQFTYLRIDQTPRDAAGVALQIDLRKGPYFAWPQYAIWLETLEGEFIQPLYITRKLAENKFEMVVTKKDEGLIFTSNPMTSEEFDPEAIFEIASQPETAGQRLRPESLPVFLHKLDLRTSEGTYVPTGDDKRLDAYTGATMLDNFLLSSRTENALTGKFRIRLEINQSFDFNDYYSSNRFPDDPIYSGNGYSAQPSVVYEAIIDPASDQRYYPMVLVGRGHHSGRDGELHRDLDNLTTALELVDRVIVEVDRRQKK